MFYTDAVIKIITPREFTNKENQTVKYYDVHAVSDGELVMLGAGKDFSEFIGKEAVLKIAGQPYSTKEGKPQRSVYKLKVLDVTSV